jgi:hypothetical protein
MPRIVIALAGSMMLWLASCRAGPQVLPDPTIPHRIAKETTVTVWARDPDGTLRQVPVRALPGWWLASPQVVEGVKP